VHDLRSVRDGPWYIWNASCVRGYGPHRAAASAMVSLSERRTAEGKLCATGDAEPGLGGGLDTVMCPEAGAAPPPPSSAAMPDWCRRSGGGHAAGGNCATPSHRTAHGGSRPQPSEENLICNGV